jgi:3-deoxy-D-manno-octulosonic-acid transferase
MHSWPVTGLSRSRAPLVFLADQLRRSVRICSGFMARTARSELLARARRAIRVGPAGERANRVAACGVAWRNVRSRAADPRHPDAAFADPIAADDGDSRAQALFGASVDVRFLPYDTPGSVRRFLARARPRLAIIMETELWPNLYRECERRGVRVLLANARLSAKSVARYRRLGSLFSGLFSANVQVAAQSAEDADRFQSIGSAPARIHVAGNVKFDLQLAAGIIDQGRSLRAAFGSSRAVWIAGSTHAGEEELLLDAHARLLAEMPDALLLLVPRHKDRFATVAELLARRGVRFARRSGGVTPDAGSQVLLVDTVGELALLYASADVAFVGGSLVAVGGHNLLEPAALGLPVLTGPHYFNSREIALLLLKQGAALQVTDAQELAAVLRRLLNDPEERRRIGAAGKQIVESNRGSVARLLALMDPWLEDSPSAGR